MDHTQADRTVTRPSSSMPYPFSTRQYARLLLLRSRIQAGLVGADDCTDAHPLVFLPDGVWLASAADLLALPITSDAGAR